MKPFVPVLLVPEAELAPHSWTMRHSISSWTCVGRWVFAVVKVSWNVFNTYSLIFVLTVLK